MAEININNLRVIYHNSQYEEQLILNGLNCHIRDGEFACFLGPSGCGKTTMLNAIAGLLQFDGSIKLDGKDSKLFDSLIGYAFQTPRLLNWLNLEDNVAFPLLAQNTIRNGATFSIEEYLNLTGITKIRKKYPLECSEGERARTNIARALAIEPNVVLMDEPFSHLDEITARKLREDLTDIWQNKKRTILFVTHNAIEAVYLADRIFILSDKPSYIKEEIEIDILRPRDPYDPCLANYYKQISNKLGVTS